MSRHCREVHGMQPMYLKDGHKPRWKPHHTNWKRRVNCPDPIWVNVEDDSDSEDACSNFSSQRNSGDAPDSGIKSNRSNNGSKVDVSGKLSCHEELVVHNEKDHEICKREPFDQISESLKEDSADELHDIPKMKTPPKKKFKEQPEPTAPMKKRRFKQFSKLGQL